MITFVLSCAIAGLAVGEVLGRITRKLRRMQPGHELGTLGESQCVARLPSQNDDTRREPARHYFDHDNPASERVIADNQHDVAVMLQVGSLVGCLSERGQQVAALYGCVSPRRNKFTGDADKPREAAA